MFRAVGNRILCAPSRGLAKMKDLKEIYIGVFGLLAGWTALGVTFMSIQLYYPRPKQQAKIL